MFAIKVPSTMSYHIDPHYESGHKYWKWEVTFRTRTASGINCRSFKHARRQMRRSIRHFKRGVL